MRLRRYLAARTVGMAEHMAEDEVRRLNGEDGQHHALRLDKAYAHLDSGLFDEDDIAEVEELAAAYYDALDRAEEPTEQEGEL